MSAIRKTVRSAGVGLVLAGLATSMSLAQTAESPSPCASVTDDKSRLQCYDAEHAMRMRKGSVPSAAATAPAPAQAPSAAVPLPAPAASQPVPPAMPARAPVARAPVAAAPAPAAPGTATSASDFGSETLPARAAKDASGKAVPKEVLVARVAAVSGRGKGDYRIELDNGQIWKESDRTGGEAPQVGETITVKPGMMGTYFLAGDSGLALRVKRIK